jgi:hypothetical protein
LFQVFSSSLEFNFKFVRLRVRRSSGRSPSRRGTLAATWDNSVIRWDQPTASATVDVLSSRRLGRPSVGGDRKLQNVADEKVPCSIAQGIRDLNSTLKDPTERPEARAHR